MNIRTLLLSYLLLSTVILLSLFQLLRFRKKRRLVEFSFRRFPNTLREIGCDEVDKLTHQKINLVINVKTFTVKERYKTLDGLYCFKDSPFYIFSKFINTNGVAEVVTHRPRFAYDYDTIRLADDENRVIYCIEYEK